MAKLPQKMPLLLYYTIISEKQSNSNEGDILTL
jgi:hypothetical protein